MSNAASGRDQVRAILTDIGVDLTDVSDDDRLRSDLGLDSTETTQLEIELAERLGIHPDLWDAHDYAISELAELVGS